MAFLKHLERFLTTNPPVICPSSQQGFHRSPGAHAVRSHLSPLGSQLPKTSSRLSPRYENTRISHTFDTIIACRWLQEGKMTDLSCCSFFDYVDLHQYTYLSRLHVPRSIEIYIGMTPLMVYPLLYPSEINGGQTLSRVALCPVSSCIARCKGYLSAHMSCSRTVGERLLCFSVTHVMAHFFSSFVQT